MTVKINIKTSKIFDDIKKVAKENNRRYVKIGINEAEGVKTYAEGNSASVAEVATWQEFGWVQSVTAKQSKNFFASWLRGKHPKTGSQLVLPPRPFVRGTAESKAKDWADLASSVIRQEGIQSIEKALVQVGMMGASDMRETIVRGGTEEEQFPRRSPLTIALYDAFMGYEDKKTDGTGGMSGDKPLFRSGVLINAISYQLE